MARIPRRNTVIAALIVALVSATAAVHAEDWPGWRGPRGDGTVTETRVPLHWTGEKNVKWKTAIPGIGHSSPIVVGDRIFLVTAIEDTNERLLYCLNRQGEIVWKQTVLTASFEHIHKLNSRASSTPVSDGQRVYVSFLDGDQMYIAAYDFDGQRLWETHPGPFKSVHGYCSSPILWKDTLVVNGDHDGDAYIVALDRATGKTVWKTDRPNKTRSYCTPIIRNIAGRNQMMLSGSKCVASFDPDTGRQWWIIDGPTEQYVASLVWNGDLVFLTCGFPEQHVMGIRADGEGNVTRTHVAWHHKTNDAAYVPSPIAVGDYFICPDDFGTVTCYKAATGEVMWSEKLARHYAASTILANGLVYLLADQGVERGEEGVMTVIKPGPKLEIVTTNVLGEPCYASPAVSEGQLFLRSDKHLFCIEESGQ
ncbi:MAG: PQQ-binding-like beta-propeller repeat protein [Phycisphaera sp.]|nr:PQQ-binding-like beta-propeller repeat protein [Phycisphaera sp.]